MRGGAVTATDFPVTVGCSAPELGKGLLSWGDSVDGGHLRDRRPAQRFHSGRPGWLGRCEVLLKHSAVPFGPEVLNCAGLLLAKVG